MARKSKSQPERFCFVVSPIGKPNSATRRRSNGILREIVRPALEPLGYRVERADHDKSPGIVTDAIMSKVLDADLVVADLTGHNANVMYEVALRHAADKPIVQVIEEGHQLPFDIQGVNTIFFRATLDGREPAVGDLHAAAVAAVTQRSVGNPILRAMQFRALQSADIPGATLVAEALTDLRSVASNIAAGAEKESLGRQHAEAGTRAWIETQLIERLRMDVRLVEIEDDFPSFRWYVFYRDELAIVALALFTELDQIGVAASMVLEDFLNPESIDDTAAIIADELVVQAHAVLDRRDREYEQHRAEEDDGTAYGS